MVTVHIVFNAHIDPIWLWPWNSGLDALLATCRGACDRLDRHPDLHFSRGEAWVYDQIEQIDTELFERIRAHVNGGRWHIVGGWWIQPDCNGPSGFGFEKQIELGREYFLEKFGQFPRIGYNVDSFGHAATLPQIMRKFGQDRYVFMRPQEWEMVLPARIFRWRGYADGPEVTTFRIAKTYTCRGMARDHIEAALSCMPEGVNHTMSFVGIGDHGGGPTEEQIAWIRENQNAFEGARLVMSSPDAFFDAIEKDHGKLSVVTGELQYHSVGCYSVHRAVKVGVRRAEHKLFQAEVVGGRASRPPDAQNALNLPSGQDARRPHGGRDARPPEERLKEAWRWVCFSHFHDTYGGSCIPSAYAQVHAQIGFAYKEADEIIQHAFRRRLLTLPDDKLQRIVLLNASDQPFDGYAEHEPWLESQHWQPNWRLIDAHGNAVPHQRLQPEALVPDDYLYYLRLLFQVKLAPGEMKTLRIDPHGVEEKDLSGLERIPNSKVKATTVSLENDVGVRLQISPLCRMSFPGDHGPGESQLQLSDDFTDTWTHEADEYDSQALFATPKWFETKVVDFGPLMASLQQRGRIGNSDVLAEWRVYAGEPFVELFLRIYWNERHKILKLFQTLWPTQGDRWDGIPGGELQRPLDGKERPVRDRILIAPDQSVHGAEAAKVGIVFPDAYAMDASHECARITLLRSPLMAHDYRFVGSRDRGTYADQGMHEFRFRFFAGREITGDLLDRHALMMHRPLLAADWTKGM